MSYPTGPSPHFLEPGATTHGTPMVCGKKRGKNRKLEGGNWGGVIFRGGELT